jgi:hypothetical protein
VAGSVSGPTIVLNDPQVIKLQSTIIHALAPFPEARAVVIDRRQLRFPPQAI